MASSKFLDDDSFFFQAIVFKYAVGRAQRLNRVWSVQRTNNDKNTLILEIVLCYEA